MKQKYYRAMAEHLQLKPQIEEAIATEQMGPRCSRTLAEAHKQVSHAIALFKHVLDETPAALRKMGMGEANFRMQQFVTVVEDPVDELLETEYKLTNASDNL